MGIWSRLWGTETRSTDGSWDRLRMSAAPDGAAVPVSPRLAESMSVVFACVRLISETIAAMPLRVLKSDGAGNREQDFKHPVHRLFAGEANPNQTGAEVVEELVASALLNGCGYVEIARNGNGAPIALTPLAFGLVSPLMLPSRRLVFDVSDPTGGTRRLLTDDLLILRDRTDDGGLTVRSRLSRCFSTVSGAWNAEQFASNYFARGASPSGAFVHPGKLSKDSAERLRDKVEDRLVGPQKAGSILLLQENMKWIGLTTDPDKSQALESRRLAVEALSRLYGVSPVLVGDLTHANYSNSVELARQFFTFAVQPWLCKLEKRIELSLFSTAAREMYSVDFDADTLLRGDNLQRWQTYNLMRLTGGATANELRGWEGLNRRIDPEGDTFMTPMNMQGGVQAGAPKDAPNPK